MSFRVVAEKIQQLQNEQKILQKKAKKEALQEIKSIVRVAGLTQADLRKVGLNSKTEKKPRPLVAVKFSDSEGHTWTGRGIMPNWLRSAIKSGKTKEEFAVKK